MDTKFYLMRNYKELFINKNIFVKNVSLKMFYKILVSFQMNSFLNIRKSKLLLFKKINIYLNVYHGLKYFIIFFKSFNLLKLRLFYHMVIGLCAILRILKSKLI